MKKKFLRKEIEKENFFYHKIIIKGMIIFSVLDLSVCNVYCIAYMYTAFSILKHSFKRATKFKWIFYCCSICNFFFIRPN